MPVLINRSYLLIKSVFILVLSLFLTSSPAFAQEWTQIETATESTLNGVYFADRNIGWAVGNNGTIIHTADGGDSWAHQDSRTTEHLNSVFFFDEFTGWVAGNNNLVLFTENGGEQWTERRPSSVSGQQITDIFFSDWKRGWAVGGPGGHIYYSDNSGLTWQRQASITAEGIITSIHFQDYETVYVIYDNQIVFAENQTHWSNSQPLTESESFSAKDLFFINENNGWVIGNDQRGGYIIQTTDGGDQWIETMRSNESHFRSIAFTDDRTGFIVGTGGTLLQTNNSGQSWGLLELETNEDLNDITFADPGNGWIVGAEGTMFRFLESEMPDISYYKSQFPSLQIANNSEARHLLSRGKQYGDKAQEYDNPRMRAPYYGRLLAAMEKVNEYSGQGENEFATQIELVLKHFWAIEHNKGAEIFNDTLEEGDDYQQVEKSRYHFQNATFIQPDSSHSYLSLAYANHSLNDFTEAISAMENAIDRVEVPDADQYTFLIELYHSEQRLSDGIELNKKGIEDHPTEFSLYETIVNLYLDQGEIEEAINYLDILIEEYPENPSYYLVRGAQLQYIALNLLEESLRLYEDVWSLREERAAETPSSNQSELEDQINVLLQEVNRLENEGTEYANKAISDMEHLAELNSDLSEAHGIIGSIYHNKASLLYEMRTLTYDQEEAQAFDSKISGNLNKAKDHYEKALIDNPDESSYWEALYYIYLDLGLEEQAEQIVRSEHFENQ